MKNMIVLTNLAMLDANILLWLQEYFRQEWMTLFWTFISSLGDGGWFWIVLSVILLIPKRTRGVGIASILALGIGALITNAALKNMFARTRPYEVIDGLILLVERQSDFSFPSGHSCASFAAATVCYKMFPKKYGVPALGLAALIAFSRLYVGVHYPSDVIAGTLIGILAAMAAYKIVEKISEKKKNKSNHRTGT